MNQLAEADLAAIAGGWDCDPPAGNPLPIVSPADLASILALLAPRWVMHLSD